MGSGADRTLCSGEDWVGMEAGSIKVKEFVSYQLSAISSQLSVETKGLNIPFFTGDRRLRTVFKEI